MTILRPYKYQGYLQFLMLLFISILIGGAFYISEYNAFVDARHELSELKSKISSMETVNADLKNDLYKNVDGTKFEELAKENNLKLEKNPEYITLNQWLSDLSH